MGLSAQAKKAIKEAFDAANDLKTDIILKTASSTFDTSTGTATQTWSEETGKGLLLNYSQFEVSSGQVQTNDRKLLLRQADFISLRPDISSDSRIEISGVLYQIIPSIKSGIANVIWEMQIRKV